MVADHAALTICAGVGVYATRREDMLARLASSAGHPVTHRATAGYTGDCWSEARSWLRGVHSYRSAASEAEITIVERSTLLPPHLNTPSEWFDTNRLASVLRRWTPASGATAVAMVPWQWPAVSSMRRQRRVLDLGDDWAALIPSRARRMRELCLRAAAEADEIVVVSEGLAELFGGRLVRVVRNGADEVLLASSPPAPPRARRIVYVGMLSERFDAPLVGRVLDRLPGWTADLYGACAYRRGGSEPSAELAALLAREDGRARWHGPVGRERLPEVLDGADVLLVPTARIAPGRTRGRSTTMRREGGPSSPPRWRPAA